MTSGDQKSSLIFDIITSLLCMFELYNVMERERKREEEREKEKEREILNTLVFCHHEITLECFPS